MKHLLLALTGIILISNLSCRKKDKEPEEYFSFYADGEFIDYPLEEFSTLNGPGKNYYAKAQSGTIAGYTISAHSRKDLSARGTVMFSLAGGHLPDRDTIILDGSINYASITDFKYMDNTFLQVPPLTGKIIFSQRNSQKLVGEFEFQAEQTGGKIITVTNGKFSIIPNN